MIVFRLDFGVFGNDNSVNKDVVAAENEGDLDSIEGDFDEIDGDRDDTLTFTKVDADDEVEPLV